MVRTPSGCKATPWEEGDLKTHAYARGLYGSDKPTGVIKKKIAGRIEKAR